MKKESRGKKTFFSLYAQVNLCIRWAISVLQKIHKSLYYKEYMQFTDFNLHPDLLKGITQAGYTECMPVQEQVLKNAFSGKDLYVQSRTGTGKTAAFLVLIFQRLLSEDMLAGKKALIIAPTRELAVQIEEEAKMLGKYLPYKTASFYGGVGYAQQEKALRENTQIMTGTPGRVLDLNKSGKMNLMDIAFLVLDEADRMFDMGFFPDLRKLIRVIPPADRRQTMLFSATLNAWVKNLAWDYTRSPLEIEITPETVTVDEVSQLLYHVPSEEKMNLLLGILEREKPESAIVFCNTKRYTEIIVKRLRLNGYKCEFIIGDLPQVKRLKVIDDLKAGKNNLLVATDVAARGLDIEDLAMVINYDLPEEAENYVHRIGRTARAGKTGKAVTLASEQDVYKLPAIERYIGKKIPSEVAMQELYANDKSTGKQTRQVEKFPKSTVSKKSPAPKRDKRNAKPLSMNKKPPKQDKAKTEKSNLKNRQNESSADISHLSFEERMEFYKKKYNQKTKDIKKIPEKKPKKAKKEKPEIIRAQEKQPEQKAPVKKGFFKRLFGKRDKN